MIHRSIAAKLLLSLVLFLAAPVAVYQQFSAADAERNALLLASIRGQGETIARALSGPLGSAGPADMPTMQTELARYVNEQIDLKLLFQPAGSDPGTFYFVAAVPPDIMLAIPPVRAYGRASPAAWPNRCTATRLTDSSLRRPPRSMCLW